jgi:regulator of replication initiation timing
LIDEAIQEGMLQRDARSLVTWLGEVAEAARSNIERVKLALQEEIDEANAKVAAFQNSYDGIVRLSSHEKSKYESSLRSLTSEIAALRRRLDERDEGVSNLANIEAENARLQSELADQKAIYDEWERLDRVASSRLVELEAAKSQIQTLVSENHRLTSRGTPRARSSMRMWNLAVAGLKAFSEIDIHDDAADTIIESFPDPSSLFDILQRLNGREEMPRKKIGGTRDWFEIDKHINTGESDMGRVYCTKLESGRMFAVVHRKKDDIEQQRFFGKLRDPSFRRNLTFDPR